MLNPSHGDYKIDAKPWPATLCTHGFVNTILRYLQTKMRRPVARLAPKSRPASVRLPALDDLDVVPAQMCLCYALASQNYY